MELEVWWRQTLWPSSLLRPRWWNSTRALQILLSLDRIQHYSITWYPSMCDHYVIHLSARYCKMGILQGFFKSPSLKMKPSLDWAASLADMGICIRPISSRCLFFDILWLLPFPSTSPLSSPFTVTQDLIREWRRAAVEEVDFQLEAKNAMQAANALRRHSVDVTCPEPLLNLCSRRVLTMVFIEGWKITDLDRMPYGADREGLARNLVHAFALLVFQEGLIHGDPHPGVALEAFMRWQLKRLKWNDNLHHFVLTGLFFWKEPHFLIFFALSRKCVCRASTRWWCKAGAACLVGLGILWGTSVKLLE